MSQRQRIILLLLTRLFEIVNLVSTFITDTLFHNGIRVLLTLSIRRPTGVRTATYTMVLAASMTMDGLRRSRWLWGVCSHRFSRGSGYGSRYRSVGGYGSRCGNIVHTAVRRTFAILTMHDSTIGGYSNCYDDTGEEEED